MPILKASPTDKAVSRRQQGSEQRRRAILDAGLEVFATCGFAAARLDEVAEKAGVAKGTIYLSFRDKEDLFEKIVLGSIGPVLARLEGVAQQADLPFDLMLSKLFDVFRSEILATRRKELIRLVITEGGRFPKIAAFYHREVVSKGVALMRRLSQRAVDSGELHSNNLTRFPHLVFAPLLLAVIWDGVFPRIEPLDIDGLFEAHRDLLCKP
jgi:AcrR family transcriptional regulator